MQVGVEEEEVIIFSTVLLSQAKLMVVLKEVVNGLNRSQVGLWLALLMAPETCFPHLQLHLEQSWNTTRDSQNALRNTEVILNSAVGEMSLPLIMTITQCSWKSCMNAIFHNYLAVSRL